MNDKITKIIKRKALSIRPIDQLPITIDFFNGVEYTTNDGDTYPGYTPVVSGTISQNPDDDNYISEEKWKALVFDAYYDVEAYTNNAMTVLGMFHLVPNFSNMPTYTVDMMMRAIAAKVEQNLFTNPANAEIRVTITQNSGGRTTNIPARENFNVKDYINMKVQTYINASGIFELVADSFQAIRLDRNDYYTKEEIDDIVLDKAIPIENLYTLDVEGWEPTEDGDGVNKKYVDINIEDLQSQINALITGDVELVSRHVKLSLPVLESFTGIAEHQEGVNIENTILIKQLKETTRELSKRTGVPLQAYKTEVQELSSTDYTIIDNYDETGNGTVDSLAGFNNETGLYEINIDSIGDQVSFDATFKITGKPLGNTQVGVAKIFRARQGNLEDVTFTHPVTGMNIEVPLYIKTLNGATVSIAAKDINIRDAGTGLEDEWKAGDKIYLAIALNSPYIETGIPLNVSDVHFDMANNRVLAEQGIATSTDVVQVKDPINESINGIALNQEEVNKQNKTAINENTSNLDIISGNVETNTNAIAANTNAINEKIQVWTIDTIEENGILYLVPEEV